MVEVLASVIGAIVAEPCQIVFGYVQASIKNFFKRKSNFNALKNGMSSLIDVKDEVQQKLNLKDQLGDVRRSQLVKDWMRQVDDLKTKVDVFLSTKSTSDGNNLQDSCCPFPLQCKLSNKLARKIEQVKQLTQSSKEVLENIVAMSDKTNPAEHIPGPSIISQNTASENLTRVFDLLSNDEVTRIGVWGMGGVGKTTLVRNLNNELGKTPSALDFGVVIWVTVSKDTNLRRIQTRIAERLNLEVNTTDEEGMMIQLHGRLKRERRFLLILDDVWEEIDLDCLGIPRPELCPLSKIIITTRLLKVCRMMKTQTDLQVKVLNDEEAWELFCEHAGEVVMDKDIRPEAEKVCKECDGLPLAIVVVGASMRGESMIELWKDRLIALQVPSPIEIENNIKDKVFLILKRSYDWLENKQTKFCFLFCCLYPEDFEIEVDELVKYWFCEGLLDGLRNYEQIKNRGIAIIHKLRECCLLEPCFYDVRVKMHDVVRDVGIWIAKSFEDECKSLVRSGIGLTRISENEFLPSYKRLSFMNNGISSLPDCVVQCPEVSTLLLQGNRNLDTVPSSFLEGFHSLKILDLSGSGITSLPSLLHLHELRALVLSRCRSLTELPPLDGLSRLLLLDCSFSGLTKIPQSLEKLSNIRQLDITSAERLETIPYSALSKLSNLESLKMLYAGRRIESQILSEVLPLLKQLRVLYASLDSIPHLTSNKVNWFERIKECGIIIGNIAGILTALGIRKNSIIIRNVCLSQQSIGWLLCNVNYLAFDGCEGLTQMFNKLVTDNVSFASLRILVISNSDIIFGGGVASFDLLPNLEDITLENLSKLESVSDLSRFLGLQFSRLRWIIIRECPQLKCVISLEENQSLEKLEEIRVSGCEMLKSLFKYPHMNLNPTAPNLREVRLNKLPNLVSLWRNDESLQNLRMLELRGCHGIRKLPLNAENAKSIERIVGEEEWWNGLEWDGDDTKMLLHNRFDTI